MVKKLFHINNRFVVNRDRSEITDLQNGKSVRLEPRLLKLLGMLTDHPGELVSRERIIKDIWDDYPGAGDGLHQAISFLRKQLGDDDKTIIKTLPKAGYSFHGTITVPVEIDQVIKRTYNWWKIAAVACSTVMLLLVVFMLIKNNTKHDTVSEEERQEAIRNSREDSIRQAAMSQGRK